MFVHAESLERDTRGCKRLLDSSEYRESAVVKFNCRAKTYWHHRTKFSAGRRKSRSGSENNGRARQRNDFYALCSIDRDSHPATARPAQPEIPVLTSAFVAVVRIRSVNLDCKQPAAIAESKKHRRARGICTFVEHCSPKHLCGAP